MSSFKNLANSTASGLKTDMKNLGNKIEEKGQDLKSQTSQAKTNATNNLTQSVNNAKKDATDHASDLQRSAQNKVPNIKNFENKGNEAIGNLTSQSKDMLNKQNEKLKSWFGTGPQPRILQYRASDLIDDVEFSPLVNDINIHMDMSRADVKKNYKMITYKAGALLDDVDSGDPAHPVHPTHQPRPVRSANPASPTAHTFPSAVTKQSVEQFKRQQFRAGELVEDEKAMEKPSKTAAKNKLYRSRAGPLIDDKDTGNPVKSNVKGRYVYKASDLIDDKEESPRRPIEEKPSIRRAPEEQHSPHRPEDDEIARLREANQRLQEELARSRAENRKNQTPAHPDSPVRRAAPKRPLGSPKAEFFNKESVKSPKAAALGRSPTSPNLNREPSPEESMGSVIRRRIEGDENVPGYSVNSPSKLFLNNPSTPLEYFSPVKHERHERPMSNYPRSPELSSKPFKNHDLLQNSTNLKDFQVVCLKDHEILYDDKDLVIEVKTKFVEGTRNSDPLLKVTLTYVNKTTTELKDFSVTYKAIPNVELSAESTDVVQRLNPKEKQVHKLNAVMLGSLETFGTIVVEYRANDEPHQIKVNSPIVLTKFMKLLPVTTGDFNIKKKILTTQYPDNFEESLKVRLSERNRRTVKDELLGKMASLETDDEKSGRFSLYGGVVRLNSIDAEALVRVIVENDTQLLMVQLYYENELEEYAKDLVKMISFLCNEKAQI